MSIRRLFVAGAGVWWLIVRNHSCMKMLIGLIKKLCQELFIYFSAAAAAAFFLLFLSDFFSCRKICKGKFSLLEKK